MNYIHLNIIDLILLLMVLDVYNEIDTSKAGTELVSELVYRSSSGRCK